MSFKAKTDHYGIADATSIVITSETDGKSASVAEVQGQDGSIVAWEVYGEEMKPSHDYELKSAVTWEAGAKKLGTVSTVSEHAFCLTELSISTSAGTAPTISASGEQVQDGATTGCTYSIPAISLATTHHAQILMEAFTLSGDGCHLTGADYSFTCDISKSTKDGECLTFDVSSGKIECSITVRQAGTTAPSITAGTDWVITSPLAESNPDADFPTWSATLTKYLAKDE